MQAFTRKAAAFFIGIIVFISGLFGLNGSSSEPSRIVKALYPEYFGAREVSAEIPGVDEGFIPQGVTYLADEGVYLLCGYMEDEESASRLCVLRDGGVAVLSLQKNDGSAFTGHAGGVTSAGDCIFISCGGKLHVLDRRSVLSAVDGGSVSFVGSVGVPCRASFCSSDGERVYVGEFCKDPGYETDPAHKLTAPDGTETRALVFGYDVSPDAAFGLSDVPSAAYATCDSVQGFALLPDGTAVLSRSYGSSDSELLFYGCPDEPDGEFSLDGERIPLYFLTSDRQTADIRTPCRSEDIEYRDGALLIVFESAAGKYTSRFKSPFVETRIVRLSAEALLA